MEILVHTSWIIWRRQWHPTPVLLPGNSHGWRSLVGCSPWGREESDTTERLHFHFSLSCIGEGDGNPLQCSCLENPRDGGAWWAAVYGAAQSQTQLMWCSSSSSSTDYHEDLVIKSNRVVFVVPSQEILRHPLNRFMDKGCWKEQLRLFSRRTIRNASELGSTDEDWPYFLVNCHPANVLQFSGSVWQGLPLEKELERKWDDKGKEVS